MIEVRELYKSFEDKDAIKNISCLFEEGIINMVIGSSGSGKPVLLKCIVGLLRPDKGKIYYDHQDFTAMGYFEMKRLRQKIGMLFQGSALFNSQTVFENISFPLVMHTSMSKAEIRKRVEYCLERVNLDKKVADLYPQELSGGMQKRVGIARAIANNPKYIFYDEPNSGLDPKTSRVIDALIKEISHEMKTTTIVNSHDMTSVFDIADHVYFIYEGQLWWNGKPSEIMHSANAELIQMINAAGKHE